MGCGVTQRDIQRDIFHKAMGNTNPWVVSSLSEHQLGKYYDIEHANAQFNRHGRECSCCANKRNTMTTATSLFLRSPE